MPKKVSMTPVNQQQTKTTPIVKAETDTKWDKLNAKKKASIQEQQAIPTQVGTPAKFPYPSFPYRLHIKAENRTCWFECEEHLHKLIQRENLQRNQYELSTNGVALVEQSTGRKGTQKRPRSRQSSNT
jgi:hypothetical protein